MNTLKRLKNDVATIDKREEADKAKSEDRDRNDALTQERRFEADKTMAENRSRNDEATIDRREIKDAKGPQGALAVFLLILIVLAVGSYFTFF